MATYLLRNRVALLRVAAPPVNSLGLAARKGIADGLLRAKADNASAVVLAGEGKTFPAGADIAEFAAGGHLTSPTLGDLIEQLEGSEIPTVAAIHGTALGGGMELALACHHRIMQAGSQVGLPEVHLGLIPGAGGTQRLPRLVGPERAIQLMATGASVKAERALADGIVDEVITKEQNLIECAVEYAEKVAAEASMRVVSSLPVPEPSGGGSFYADLRANPPKEMRADAALAVVDAVEAAATSGSFAEGLRREAELFEALSVSTQAKARQHAFFAERQIGKIVGLGKGVKPRPVASALVVGAGTMGQGIAMCFASAGLPVTLLDSNEEALARGVATVRKNYEATAKKGRLTSEQVESNMGRIGTTTSYDDARVREADVAVEAAFETLEVKHAVMAALDAACKPGCVLATNTSTLDIDAIASATARPAEVVGMHFFSPANVMPLLENVRGTQTSDEVIATTMAIGKALRKKAVLARSCFGFIGNRMLEGYCREAIYLLEEGCVPRQVDEPLRSFGMPMGPLQMCDLAGNDIGYKVRQGLGLHEVTTERYYGGLADTLVEGGRLGQKTKVGWYDYSAGRAPVDDPEVASMIEKHSAALGMTRREISADEVLDRCLLPMVNEGFKVLEEGIAQRESDIDVVYLYGYGFPRHRGGPMHWARHGRDGGLPKLVDDLAKYAEQHPQVSHWKPSQLLLDEAAKA